MKLLHILPNITFVQAIATNRNVRDKCIYYLQMLNFACSSVYAMPLGNNDEKNVPILSELHYKIRTTIRQNRLLGNKKVLQKSEKCIQ